MLGWRPKFVYFRWWAALAGKNKYWCHITIHWTILEDRYKRLVKTDSFFFFYIFRKKDDLGKSKAATGTHPTFGMQVVAVVVGIIFSLTN